MTQPEDFEALLHRLFGDAMRADQWPASDMWSALANVKWHHEDGRVYSCSFRYAGELVADLTDIGDYVEWYMSGPIAMVSPHIREALAKEGWTPSFYDSQSHKTQEEQ